MVPLHQDAASGENRQDSGADSGQRGKESRHNAGGLGEKAERNQEINGSGRPARRDRYRYKQPALCEAQLGHRVQESSKASGGRANIGTSTDAETQGKQIGQGAEQGGKGKGNVRRTDDESTAPNMHSGNEREVGKGTEKGKQGKRNEQTTHRGTDAGSTGESGTGIDAEASALAHKGG